MKALFASVLFAAVLSVTGAMTSTAYGATSSELLAQAQKAYAAREYDSAGVNKAQEAADLYGQLAAQTTDAKAQAKFLALQSEALYFIGNFHDAKELKIKFHLAGMNTGDKALKAFGITDVQKVDSKQVDQFKKSLSTEELNTLVMALYYRGINLGQWGQANGVMQSLSRWPELRDNMQLVISLGQKEFSEYGAYRTLGRGYQALPGVLGGDLKKAEKYLKSAIAGTKAGSEIYSTNGYNNTFLAEILKDAGKKDEARELLQAFLKADPAKLNSNMIPEIKRAQREATDILKSL